MDVQRELNPHLFGTPVNKSSQTDPGAASSLMARASEPARSIPYAPNDLKAMEHQIQQLGRAMVQMEKRTETIAFKMEELARSVHQRLERFSTAMKGMEESQKRLSNDGATRIAGLISKVNERKVNDSKIEEMIERHNAIVRTFEARLLSLQRLVNEQEMALHGARAALEEQARRR
ncbi:MAG TPA: hypothetical protein VM432_12840 [Bdellovibrionales bacterium]|nr:hypothetical protein [Bdellovibrionales bacterium]